MVRKVGLAAAGLLVAFGVTALLLAVTFGNLSGLSSGFAVRKTMSFRVATAGLLVGAALYLIAARHTGGLRTWLNFGRFLLLTGLAGWLAFTGMLFAFQDRLVFSPRSLSPDRLQRIARDYPWVEEVNIPVSPGVTLHGWLVPTAKRPAPLVILFAGQGSEVSRYLDFAHKLPCCAWAFINYRGYGLSTGQPTDADLLADAVRVYDYFAARADIDETKIFAIGGSLGTGVATYLSAHRPLAGVILFSPYDSIGGGVSRDIIPFVPTRWIWRNRFDVSSYAAKAQAPAIAVIGEKDTVIRPERSRRLMAKWGQRYQIISVEDGDHYSIYNDDAVWEAIAAFVDERVR